MRPYRHSVSEEHVVVRGHTSLSQGQVPAVPNFWDILGMQMLFKPERPNLA